MRIFIVGLLKDLLDLMQAKGNDYKFTTTGHLVDEDLRQGRVIEK
jgi:hypothetical protein